MHPDQMSGDIKIPDQISGIVTYDIVIEKRSAGYGQPDEYIPALNYNNGKVLVKICRLLQ